MDPATLRETPRVPLRTPGRHEGDTLHRTTRLLPGLAALVALALAVLPSAEAAAPADGHAGLSRHHAKPARTIDYVAMGDSYSAGPLVPPPPGKDGMHSDPFACARSWNNYPAFVAGYLRVRTFTDVTCSGAQTGDFAHPQELSFWGQTTYAAPQLDALSRGTDLVTIGIGGNDYGLFGSMVDNCGRLAAEHPESETPCQDFFTVDGVDSRASYAKAIRERISAAVREVQERAPRAEVYVVAYPRLLPDSGTCDAIGFAAGDVPWGNRIEHLLNESLRKGARSHGAHFVSMEEASAGHDACAGEDAWINGRTTVMTGPTAAASFHPFLVGERGVAQQTYRVITGKVAPAWDNAHLAAIGQVVVNPGYVP